MARWSRGVCLTLARRIGRVACHSASPSLLTSRSMIALRRMGGSMPAIRDLAAHFSRLSCGGFVSGCALLSSCRGPTSRSGVSQHFSPRAGHARHFSAQPLRTRLDALKCLRRGPQRISLALLACTRRPLARPRGSVLKYFPPGPPEVLPGTSSLAHCVPSGPHEDLPGTCIT